MITKYFEGFSFITIFLITSALALLWYHLIAGVLYFILYVQKYATTWKTQLRYPKFKTVVYEAIEGSLSILAATFNLSLTIYFALHRKNRMINNWEDANMFYHLLSIIILIAIVEVFEWWFHWFSHKNKLVWKIHKKHHLFPNPTSYAVLSDHPLDMFIKSSPLLWLPFTIPVWDVALIGWFSFVNFIYGTYLHAGFEFPWLPSRHSKYFVSSWHHNTHHSLNMPINFGFFTGFMDILCGTRFTPADKIRDRSHRRSQYLLPARLDGA